MSDKPVEQIFLTHKTIRFFVEKADRNYTIRMRETYTDDTFVESIRATASTYNRALKVAKHYAELERRKRPNVEAVEEYPHLLDVIVFYIRSYMQAEHISATEFARRAGINRRTVQKWLTKTGGIQLVKAKSLARFLKLPWTTVREQAREGINITL